MVQGHIKAAILHAILLLAVVWPIYDLCVTALDLSWEKNYYIEAFLINLEIII